jgi:hypothetical protein
MKLEDWKSEYQKLSFSTQAEASAAEEKQTKFKQDYNEVSAFLKRIEREVRDFVEDISNLQVEKATSETTEGKKYLTEHGKILHGVLIDALSALRRCNENREQMLEAYDIYSKIARKFSRPTIDPTDVLYEAIAKDLETTYKIASEVDARKQSILEVFRKVLSNEDYEKVTKLFEKFRNIKSRKTIVAKAAIGRGGLSTQEKALEALTTEQPIRASSPRRVAFKISNEVFPIPGRRK